MRIRTSLLAILLIGGLVAPATARSELDADLDVARGELEAASRELEDIEAAVRRVDAQVAAADDRLRTATTDLAAVRADLASAERDARAAGEAERAAADALQRATDELDALVAAHVASRDELGDRAIATFKRGGALTSDLAFAGIVRAGDLHELAVNRGVVTRLLTDQRTLVEDTGELTRATADAHADVAAARRASIEAARVATQERARVAELVGAQERLVTRVGTEAERRREALATLERDAAARAVLVRDLEARVEELERAAASALVPVTAVPLDGPSPPWAVGLPPAGRPWAATIVSVAGEAGIDARLLAALVWTESAFRPDAVSHAGALGLAQLMPGTARGLGVDPHDPVSNLRGGARYLADQLATFGRIDLALAAYNAGPGRVQRAGNAVPNIVETQLYVVRVLERYERLRQL